jgi:NAD(P)-dependent dehydrogenase (short-subunit alcohol dehydrogenase family)
LEIGTTPSLLKIFVKGGMCAFVSVGGDVQNQRTVLITGCSSGIGLESSVLLAQKGWKVFASLRNMKKSGPLKERSKGLSVEILQLDVDNPLSVRRGVAAVLKKAGGLDALVNNAGWGAFGALEDFTDEEILSQYQTNLFGLFRLTREVLPSMRARGRGRILNISSVAGKMTFAGVGLYCSSKHAVEAFSESLRLELRPFGVQVGMVEPGQFHTRFKDNRQPNQTFLDGKSPYQSVVEKILRYGNGQSGQAPGPEVVARTIRTALEADKMALRYPVGTDARLFPIAQRFLPDGLYDRIMVHTLKRFQEARNG